MKEITRISLAQLPYNIEVAAKKKLEAYLHEIEAALNADEDAMREIEARVIELLAERDTKGEKVISADDIVAIQQQLGSPQDFVDDDRLDDAAATETGQDRQKRLMRDEANAMLGGVCAGLGAYFRIDPVWMRVIFVILLFVTSGAALFFYLIAWVIMPSARTATERLQMQGKPVTLEALQEESVIVSRYNDREKLILKSIRQVSGLVLLIAGIVLLVGSTFGIWWFLMNEQPIRTEAATAFGWYMVPGVLFSIVFGLVGAVLLRGKMTLSIAVVSSVILALGLGIALRGFIYGPPSQEDQSSNIGQSMTERSLDASLVAGSRQLRVDTEDMDVHYHVASGAPRIELQFSSLTFPDGVTPKIERDGEVLRVSMTGFGNKVWLGSSRASLHIYGPALDKVAAVKGLSYYGGAQQDALTVEATERGSVELLGDTKIRDLTVVARDTGALGLGEATIENITGELMTQGYVTAATVQTVDVQMAESCSQPQGRPTYAFDYVGKFVINDQPYSADRAYPCADITIEKE